MKLLIMPKSNDEILKTLNTADGYMLGVKELSTNMPYYYDENELFTTIKLLKEDHKEVFVALNKNIHNTFIEELKSLMIKLDSMDIEGIVYYDMAIVNIKEESKLKTSLVWNQEHLTNNYITSNYWYNFGAKYTLLSSEITLEEVKEIKDNAKAKLILPIFGHLPMFVSKRHLVKNYLETFEIKDDSNIYYMQKDNDLYPIIDDKDGTVAYSANVLNGISEVPLLDIDYLLLNSFEIPSEVFIKVVNLYKTVNEDNKKAYEEEIDSLLKTDYGFLYKETIFKVKK